MLRKLYRLDFVSSMHAGTKYTYIQVVKSVVMHSVISRLINNTMTDIRFIQIFKKLESTNS